MRPLKGIDHVVVLMMENRSFDHMLGYLSLPEEMGGAGRTDVDGLTGTEENRHQGRPFRVRRLTNTALEADPHHDFESVREQIETEAPGGSLMGGFVRSYSTVKKVKDLGEVMGFYTGTELPTFDFLARHFCVCDRWFCSFPGATIPNRLFSLAGTSLRMSNSILRPFTRPSVFEVLGEQDVPWEVYFEDIVPALALFSGHGAEDDPHLHGLDFLVKRRKDLKLPPASWIDPFFLRHKDDDHPPADVTRGQLLVQKVVDGLRVREEWPRTLLIVTYDEHGGYYDHVTPPGFGDGAAIPDDSPDPKLPDGYNPFVRLGPRVPTLLVSPALKRSVCHEVLDHTAIVRTLIEQFCPHPGEALAQMPRRVRDFAKPIPGELFEAVAPPSGARAMALGPRRGGARRAARRGKATSAGARASTRPPRATAAGFATLQVSLDRARRRSSEATQKRRGRSPRRKAAAPATALEKELRPFLNLLCDRGVVRRRQLPFARRTR